MEPVSRRAAMLGAAGVAGAALVGCSTKAPAQTQTSSGASTPTESASASPTATVDTTPRWPLTGKVLKNADDAKRIAVAVKVPDNQGEHPQMGLDKADIVYVELDGYPAAVGQSGTRLVPIFHTQYADAVNPVRSIRPVDIPMLSPITAIIGNTGAYPWVLDYAKEFAEYIVWNKSYMATKGTGSYSILANRVRTLNGVTYYDRAVACHPKELAAQTKKFADGPQQMYFPWAASDDEVSTAVSGEDASFISVPWKKGNTYPMSYTWSEKQGRYLRSMPWGKHVLADGTRVSCDNVLVIKAKQVFGKIYASGKIKTSGPYHMEPIHKIINEQGTFYYAQGGKYVKGTWTKGEVNEVFQFTLDDGSPLKMAPGQTFVELPNTTSKITIKG
ncbi:MAG: DUF3048 domain-containing protein [Propionicimonas sp.]|uniref:DUF3048 domain-containing protein n=1 Tax=Propionicimonas sp. TaxID=1955623 RepID=UPI003D0F7C3E